MRRSEVQDELPAYSRIADPDLTETSEALRTGEDTPAAEVEEASLHAEEGPDNEMGRPAA
jgi:hypothetical protein